MMRPPRPLLPAHLYANTLAALRRQERKREVDACVDKATDEPLPMGLTPENVRLRCIENPAQNRNTLRRHIGGRSSRRKTKRNYRK